MNVHRYPSRAAAAIAAAVLLVCTSTPADAATTANATSASQAASSGAWGAVATQSSTAPYGSGSLKLNFTNNGGVGNPSFTSQYFTVQNTGNLPLTAASYGGSTSAPSNVQFMIESCSATWSADACPGGTLATVLTTQGTSTIQLTAGPAPATSAAGLMLRARVAATGNVSKSAILTLNIDITVDRSQVRSATTTGG